MSLYTAFVEPLLHNQVVTGLSFTAALGAVGYQLRSIPAKFETLFRRQAVLKLTVDDREIAYRWLDQWLATLPYGRRTTTVMLKTRSGDSKDEPYGVGESSKISDVYLTPGYGSHLVWWRRRLLFVERSQVNVQGARSGTRESIAITTFGRSQALLWSLVTEARGVVSINRTIDIKLWTDGYWSPIGGKRPRALSTVIMPAVQRDRIVRDLEQFTDSRSWYGDRGIPYRRALLFSGPPGVGKTSLVMALAAHLDRPLCSLNFGSLVDDDGLFSAVLYAPPSAIVLIEDIDCAIPAESRDKDDDDDDDDAPVPLTGSGRKPRRKQAAGVTKAGLLNALDGVGTPDGRLFILTSNKPEVLDAAMLRPGRIDVHERFGLLGIAEQREMARLFYGDVVFPDIGRDLPAAEMQGAFLAYPNDPAKAAGLLMDLQQKAA
jgi:chaperone BCS1